MESLAEYQAWLEKTMLDYSIEKTELMILIRALTNTLNKLYIGSAENSPRHRVYYNIYNRNGSPAAGWKNAAELAIWLKYSRHETTAWLEFICTRPIIKFIIRKGTWPNLNQLVPRTRLSREKIFELDAEFTRWKRKH